MKILLNRLFVLVLLAGYGTAWGTGTSGGDGFSHFVNQPFDFHIATPPDWLCENCGSTVLQPSGSESSLEWVIHPPETKTRLSVTFISNFPADSEDELKATIQQRTGISDWYNISRGDDVSGSGIVGWSNSPLRDANGAIEYYLIDKKLVIRLEWQKDSSSSQRAMQLDAVKNSIDRASAPPRIKSINFEGAAVVKPGDTSCLRIEVDDLRRKFTIRSLKTLEIAAVLKHWSFKDISWIGDEATFKACYKVSNAFPSDGMRIEMLMIEDDDANDLRCERDSSDATKLRCSVFGKTHVLTPIVPTVDNPQPDRDGPDIRDVSFDDATMSLKIDAVDPSGIHAAQVYLKTSYSGDYFNSKPSLVFASEEFEHGDALSIASLATAGWNTIDAIVVYDRNGFATMLRLPRAKSHATADTTNFELLKWNAAPVPTTIRAISFLKSPGAPQ